MNGETDGYYAGKVIRAIDEATEGSGGIAYQAARKSRREQALEFEDQAAVARLVENKSRTDRTTALEDTWRTTVLRGSIDDLRKVKRSLLLGSDSTTRTAGRQAWKDIRAQTIQYVTDEATKSATRTSAGAPNITPGSMDRALRSIGEDKLNEIFGPGTAKQLDEIMEATRIVKTEPPTGFKGSATFANAIAFLERRLASIPRVGDLATGSVRAVAAVKKLGETGRQVRDGGTIAVDTSGIARAKGLRKAWFKSIYTKDQPISDGYAKPMSDRFSYRESVELYFFNCAERTMATAQSILRGADSKTVGTFEQASPFLHYSEVAPETIGEAMLETVCSWKLSTEKASAPSAPKKAVVPSPEELRDRN
jgi:hypothetical protein